MTMFSKNSLFLLLLFLLLSAANSFAEMTVYFKDGREIQVLKIVFKGEHAELFRSDGTVLSVAVSTIDLDSSGIASPAGTYGETSMTRPAPSVRKPGVIVNSPARQMELKEEWESAAIVAVARRDLGSIHRGDTVHAYSPETSDAYKSANSRSKYYWYDDDRQVYWPSDEYQDPAKFDDAYIIIYRKTDGSYGKKIIDATGFNDNFEIQKSQLSSAPALHPIPPENVPQPAPELNTPPNNFEDLEPQPREPSNVEPQPKQNAQPLARSEPPKHMAPVRTNWITFVSIVIVVIAGGGGVLFLVLKGRSRAFINTSNFPQYERDLQDFELEIWLRHGKTLDQLMEICLKKFYQENPAALNIVNRVWKGAPKNFVVPLISKEANISMIEAESMYSDFQTRVATIRRFIENVCRKKGLQPKSPVSETISQSATTESTVRSIPAQPARIATAPVAAAAVAVPSAPGIEISIPIPEKSIVRKKRAGKDLPSYAANVLDQLAFLTEEKK